LLNFSIRLTLGLAGAAAVLATGAPARDSAPSCRGAALAGRFAVVPGSAGAGNISYALRLKNVSAAACTVGGLPAGRLLGSRKEPLPTHVRAERPGARGVPVALRPGQSVVASARFSPDVPGPGETGMGPCEPTAHWFRVAASGGGTTRVKVTPATPVCEHGRLFFSVYRRAR